MNMSPQFETIGARIKRLRVEQSLSQADVAARAGLTQGAIAAQEQERTQKSRHLLEIAAALGTTAEYLSTGVGEAHSSSGSKQLLRGREPEILEYIRGCDAESQMKIRDFAMVFFYQCNPHLLGNMPDVGALQRTDKAMKHRVIPVSRKKRAGK